MELVAIGQAAEAAGLEAIGVGETRGPDAVTVLSALALKTSKVRLGSSILPIASRPPALAAMTFAALSTLASDRLFAGFGVSTKTMIEGWFGLSFQRPVATMREYVAIFRDALANNKTDVISGMLRSHGFRLALPGAPLPVYLGVMGPRMVELAGEIADGAILAHLPPDQVGERLEWLRRGLDRAGRRRQDVRVAVTAFNVYLGPNPEAVRTRIAKRLGVYSALPTHNAAYTTQGEESRIDAFAVVGSADQSDRLRARIEDYGEAGVDQLLFMPWTDVRGTLDGYLTTIANAGRALSAQGV